MGAISPTVIDSFSAEASPPTLDLTITVTVSEYLTKAPSITLTLYLVVTIGDASKDAIVPPAFSKMDSSIDFSHAMVAVVDGPVTESTAFAPVHISDALGLMFISGWVFGSMFTI